MMRVTLWRKSLPITYRLFIVGCVLTLGGWIPPAAAQFVDCNGNGIDDACELDCGMPGGLCDVPGCGAAADCNANGIPDNCDTQPAKLIAADAAAGDQFGGSISMSGFTAIIGSPFDDDADPGSGSAYVFVHTGPNWTQQAKLTADDAAAGDLFGVSVSISRDTAVIGSLLDDDAGSGSGAAYVFTRNGADWTQQAKLTADDAAAGDQFGVSVSIFGDTVVIGSRLDDAAGALSGAAYIFVRTGADWTQQAKLTADDAAAGDLFGTSVSIHRDTAVIGSPFDDDAGALTGSAYIFVRGGGVWTQQAKLTAEDPAAGDRFGHSVSMSGETAVIGAIDGDAAAQDSGSAYIFVRAAAVWTQQAKLIAPDAAADDQLGISVSISGDTAVIGADSDDDAGSQSGSAYVFVRTAGVWTQKTKLIAPDAEAGDGFCNSVSICGETVVIGSFLNDAAGANSGSAYIFSTVIFDCQADGIPDDCQLAGNDANGNAIPDTCDTLGDFDGDGVFSTDDLPGFTDNLLDPDGTILGDFDGNGLTDGEDIQLAADCLVDGICP